MKDLERVPLRIVLRNFLNHIENLESQNCAEKSYEAEFQDLKIFSENVKILKEYSCLEGEKEVNRKKNRYKDILPFDISRVVLTEYAGIPGSDYINANFIKGASGSPAYIASQGPLPSTVNDFWRMVVQCEVQVIVMACNEEEAGKAKCEKYWVDEGDEKQFGMINVKLLKSSTVCPDFSVRTMRLKYTTNQKIIEERTVCQLHYVAWPDHGVPTVVQPLLDMVRLVRDTQASETLPVLVHCSAGCGRTGTICAIDYVWGLLRTGKLTNDFSLLSLIRDMRKQRIAMVQTKEQYVLVHQAVRELFKEQLCMIDSHPYENVDPDGLLIVKEEENPYDCIEYSSTCSEEKRDNKEKEIVPPPLPSKKNFNKFPSKFEKDVENLTEQQRSMNYIANVRGGLVPFCQIDGKKKDNNKELDNFDKINKKVHENKIKLDSNKPIPSKGILRVPQLETVLPKSTACIKRSKSLKIVSSCDKNSLSFCQNSPIENKRRSSLESNIDEHIFELDCNNHLISRPDMEPVHKQKQKENSQAMNKYDIIKNQDHRTFIRSLTSIDMRPKVGRGSSNALVSSLENSLAKQKYKLLRSNTQVNILKRSNTTSQLKSDFSSTNDSVSKVKYNHNSQFSNSKMSHNNSHENILQRKLKLQPKLLGSTAFTSQQQNSRQTSISKDIYAKTRDQADSSFQKVEPSKHLKEPAIFRISGNDRHDHLSNLPYEECCDNYLPEKGDNFTNKQDKFGVYGIQIHHTNNPHSSEFLPLVCGNSKYTRTNHLLVSRTPKKLQSVNAMKQHKTNLSLGIQGCSKDGFNSSLPFHDDLTITRHSNMNEEFHRTSGYINGEYSTISGQKCNNSSNEHYIVDESIENGTNSWLERDNCRTHTNFNTSCIMTKSWGAQSLLVSKLEGTKEAQRRLESEIDYSCGTNMSGLVDPFEEMKVDQDLSTYDISYNKESIPINNSEMKYTLQNRKNVQQFNSCIHNSRHANISAPNVCSDLSSSLISQIPCKSALLQQRSAATSYSQDTYFVSEAHRNYRDNECFHSAPGVDLDQVAASITKNDENLMKVTLEELQVRKTKLQMTSKSRVPMKGFLPSTNSCDKKKQQQYL